MPFQKGQSGNPNGRPKKERVWTAFIEKAGNKTIEYDGQKVARKKLLSELAMQGATTGAVTLPDGTILKADGFKEWADFVKWIYTHIDGPAKFELEHSGDVGLKIEYVNNWRQPSQDET